MEARLNRLDHLQFAAASLVVLWHFSASLVPANVPMRFPILSIFQQGHTGVALFCVISGFLFTWLYYDKGVEPNVFAKKRAARILPMFVVTIVIAFFTVPSADISKIVLGILTTLPDAGGGTLPGYSAVCWTILVEIQFYALFPLLILFSRRYGWHYLVSLVALLVCVRAMTWFNAPDAMARVAYWSIFGRLDQFLFGMLAAIAFRNLSPLSRMSRLALFGAGIIGSISLLRFYETFAEMGGYYGNGISASPLWIGIPLIEAACYATIILGYLSIPTIPFTAAKVMDAIFSHGGKVSYSMYLTHVMLIPVIVLVIRTCGLSVTSWHGRALAVVLIVLPTLVAVASVTYYLIEKPMMDILAKPKAEKVVPFTGLERASAA